MLKGSDSPTGTAPACEAEGSGIKSWEDHVNWDIILLLLHAAGVEIVKVQQSSRSSLWANFECALGDRENGRMRVEAQTRVQCSMRDVFSRR
jgi:hypothetical protein